MTAQPQLSIPSKPKGITLLEFNRRVRDLIYSPSVQDCWVIAETSDVRVSRGHCYLELLQKDSRTGATVAKAGAVIWASTFGRLDAGFFAATGNRFGSGMKVMVKVSATFHEQYGFKLVISDIDADFTLGDMARQRIEILNRLKREGIIDMNRQLGFPLVPRRIAVISAQGAAGYGDFMKQLAANPHGIVYYTCLFQAAMQGVNTAPSIIAALERIVQHEELFDCVVIIRGGGSTTDLNSFDNYELAANIAQFPLPVITGIGHDRDVTVLDFVAAQHLKTPTAVAEFIISFGASSITRLNELSNTIVATARDAIARSNEQLAYVSTMIPAIAHRIIDNARARLAQLTTEIPIRVSNRITAEHTRLRTNASMMHQAIDRMMLVERNRIDALNDKVALLSPRNILNRGYSLTMCNGHVVTDASQLKVGDEVTSHFKCGSVRSRIDAINNKKQ